MTLSANEQYMLELINAARLDPLGAAADQGIALNQGITSAHGGPIQSAPMQVLAPNAVLENLAVGHSEWMVGTHSFGHGGAGNLGIAGRIAGSQYVGPLTFRENLSAVATSGRNQTQIIEAHHDNLYASAPHRAAIFDENQSEIGIGIVTGRVESLTGSVVTQVFGARGHTDPFVTGVAYTDNDNDDFYSIGEGLSGVRFRVGGARDITETAGGYAVSASDDLADVVITQGSAVLGNVSVDMTAGNVKVDLVVNASGDYALALSGNATLGDGIDDAHLLGAGHLDLTGNNASNTLTGNSGNNTLSGGDGHDRLVGGNGSDRLVGGDQGDRLFGGNGRDMLIGGEGYDVLVGGNFHDRLYGGTGNDRLYGGSGNDYMVAGNGHDRIFGNNGHDRLYGNGGADRLAGNNGNDLLNGGAGNDLLIGGNGADRFVFIAGQDRVWDFENDIDTIIISSRLTGGATIDDLIDDVEIVNGNAVFDFGNGNTLIVRNITNADILADDLNIV